MSILVFMIFLSWLGSNVTISRPYSVKLLFTFPDSPIQGTSLAEPQAIAAGPDGSIFVVDTGNNRVVKFNERGDFVLAIGGFGWETEQFDRPLDISAKTGLEIFVADHNNERIERYDKKLNYISSFRSDATISDNLAFGFPSSVDISAQGELFICDSENNRILKLDAFGEPRLSFGDFNWGEGQLEEPVRVEVGLDNSIFVSDRTANQIIVFDYYGNYTARFGNDLLTSPHGLALSIDKLFVADSGENRVAVFDKKYQLIYAWGEEGTKLGAFQNPVDVALFKDKIYVLDSGNNRVQVFALLEE